MYELVNASGNTYYINSPAKIGLYKNENNEVYLIDSGNDKDAGRKVRKILDENGWTLKCIINTHSNADHIGGNKYLQQQTGCKIFAGGVENAFTRYPVLEPSFLYGGYPCKELRHKFLLAQDSDAEEFDSEGFPGELEIIPLKGHFFDMIGVRTPDGVVFLADCVSSIPTLEKYGVSFIYDVAEYLRTLDKVAGMQAELFVPAHTEATTDMTELIKANRDKVNEIANTILSKLKEPKNFELLLKEIFDEYSLTMNFEQYVLVGSTVRSYLSYLKDADKLEVVFENNTLLWHTK